MATKDISDWKVCRAVQDYQDAMAPLFEIMGNPILVVGPPLDSPPWPYEALAAQTGQSEKVCYRAMERADKRGLIDYGTSLRTGWLTDKGKALLEQGDHDD